MIVNWKLWRFGRNLYGFVRHAANNITFASKLLNRIIGIIRHKSLKLLILRKISKFRKDTCYFLFTFIRPEFVQLRKYTADRIQLGCFLWRHPPAYHGFKFRRYYGCIISFIILIGESAIILNATLSVIHATFDKNIIVVHIHYPIICLRYKNTICITHYRRP